MKFMEAFLILAATAGASGAQSLPSAEAERLSEAAAVVRELRGAPDNGIPMDAWDHADCVAVIPGLKKAAFIFGGEFGKGVISCRTGHGWSAPLFIELQKGSAGFQVGAEQVDVVLLVMNRSGVEKMLGNKVNLGADASIAAGPVGRAASASTDGRLDAQILAYSRAKGLFAGINLSGGSLRADDDANRDAYASAANRDVLFGGTVTAPQQAQAFLATLGADTRATAGTKK